MAEPLDFGEEIAAAPAATPPRGAQPIDFGEEIKPRGAQPLDFGEEIAGGVVSQLAAPGRAVARAVADLPTDVLPPIDTPEWRAANASRMQAHRDLLRRLGRQAHTVPAPEPMTPTSDLGASVIGGLTGRAPVALALPPEEARARAAMRQEREQQDAWHAAVEAATTRREQAAAKASAEERFAGRGRGATGAEGASGDPVAEGEQLAAAIGNTIAVEGGARDTRSALAIAGARKVGGAVADALEATTRPFSAVGAGVAAALAPVEKPILGSAWDTLRGAEGAMGWRDMMRYATQRGVNPITELQDALFDYQDDADRQQTHETGHAIGEVMLTPLDPLWITKFGQLTRIGRAAATVEEGTRMAQLSAREAARAVAYMPPKKVAAILERLSEVDRAYERGNLASQFAKGQRSVLSIGGWSPIPNVVESAIGKPIDWITKGIKMGDGKLVSAVRDTARAFRVTGLLPEAEQDALLMRYFSGQEQASMADAVASTWARDAKMLANERRIFDRAAAKGLTAEQAQRDALVRTFEEGRQGNLEERIARALEEKAISPAEGQYLIRVRDRMDAFLAKEQKIGIDVERLTNDELTYLHHAMTKEAKDELAKRFPKLTPSQRAEQFMAAVKKRPGFAEQRAMDMSVLDANEYARELGLKADLFYTDIPTVVAARELAHIRATSTHSLLTRLGERFGTKLPAGVLEGIGRGGVTIPAFAEKVAEHTARFTKAEAGVWDAIQADPRRFLGAVADEKTARALLARTRNEARARALAFERKAQAEGDAAALEAYDLAARQEIAQRTHLDAPGLFDVRGFAEANAVIARYAERGVAPPAGILERAASHAKRLRAVAEASDVRAGDALGRAELAATGAIERAGRAEGIYRELAPGAYATGREARRVEALGEKQALARARAQAKGRPIADQASAFQRLGVALDELEQVRGIDPQWMIVREGALAGHAMPAEIAQIAHELHSVQHDSVKGPLRQMYDAYTKWFKAWSLSPRPAFHARNLFGNLHNNALAGVYNPIDYALATMAQTSEKQLGRVIRLDNGETKTLGELLEEAKATGADKSQFSMSHDRMREQVMRDLGQRESEGAVLEALRPIRKYVPLASADEATSAWIKAGMATGDFIERNARLAHYIAKRRMGLSAEQAAQSVKRYLFDYSELTATERGIRDLGVPFYGWLRNNFALQATEFVRQPAKYAAIVRALHAAEDPNAPERELYPEWMQKAGVVRTGRAQNGIARAYTLTGYWPGWDVTRFGADDLFGNLHPAAGALVSLLSGVDTFRHQPISGLRNQTPGVEGRRRAMFGADAPDWLATLLGKTLPAFATELDRSNPLGAFGSSNKALTEEGKRVDQPGEAPRVNLLPGVRTAQGRDRVDLPWKDRLSQYLTGVRPYAVDLSREAFGRLYEDKKGAEEQDRLAVRMEKAGFTDRAADHRAQAQALRRRYAETQEAFRRNGIPLYPEP